MTEKTATEFFTPLTRKQKLQFLAQLCHDITIVGREAYDLSGQVAAPDILRVCNECQHKTTGVLAACLRDDHHDFPAPFIATIFFGERQNKQMQQMLASCFERATVAFQRS